MVIKLYKCLFYDCSDKSVKHSRGATLHHREQLVQGAMSEERDNVSIKSTQPEHDEETGALQTNVYMTL